MGAAAIASAFADAGSFCRAAFDAGHASRGIVLADGFDCELEWQILDNFDHSLEGRVIQRHVEELDQLLGLRSLNRGDIPDRGPKFCRLGRELCMIKLKALLRNLVPRFRDMVGDNDVMEIGLLIESGGEHCLTFDLPSFSN